jgi:hypothetical protein
MTDSSHGHGLMGMGLKMLTFMSDFTFFNEQGNNTLHNSLQVSPNLDILMVTCY